MGVQLEDAFIRTNGICLHAVQAGPVGGPLVVLLHGFPEFWYAWRHQIGPLAEAGFRVVAPDQRGYNLSDKPRGIASYTLDQLTADVTGILDSLGRADCFLVGHDWGAAVAWETALRFPGRIRKLAILNVPHLDVMRRFVFGSLKQALKSWYIFAIQIPGLAERSLSAGEQANAVRMLLGSGKRGTFSQVEIEEYKKAWSQPGAWTSMLNWYRAIFRHNLSRPRRFDNAAPRRVHVPVLMLWGKKDVALSQEMAQPSVDLCDDGRLIFFENATHWVQHDEAEAVTHALVEFFSS